MKTRIQNEKVIAATGKDWGHWSKVLDKFDCKKQGHKETAKFLKEKHGLSDWWSQCVTIEYELAKGIRQPTQRSDRTYAITVQRTVDAGAKACWGAFTTAKGLNKWFASKTRVDLKVGGRYTAAGGDKCTYKKIVPDKRLVMTWEHPKHTPGSEVEVLITPKRGKTTVEVSHRKIAKKSEADELKKAWSGVMDDFRSYVEG
ncbi:MAG TPA: SRPBCC domain-containing protein [Fimbriimonadaceae bacterium]|nr:SRPBCC domain-containing protein [Fimbriimonadaceae bacterium]